MLPLVAHPLAIHRPVNRPLVVRRLPTASLPVIRPIRANQARTHQAHPRTAHLRTVRQKVASLVRHPNCLQAPPSVPRIIHLRRQQAAIAQHPVPVPLATLALQVTSHLQAITCHLVMPHPAKTIPLATPAQLAFKTVQPAHLSPAMRSARMPHLLPTQSHSRFPR